MASRVRIRRQCRKLNIPLAASAAVYQGEAVGVVPFTFTAKAASASTYLRPIGVAVDDALTASGDTVVCVDLYDKADLEYYANDSTPIVLATDFLKKAYFKDGGTVTLSANNGSGVNYTFAGLIYDVDSRDGVGIKPSSPEVGSLLS